MCEIKTQHICETFWMEFFFVFACICIYSLECEWICLLCCQVQMQLCGWLRRQKLRVWNQRMQLKPMSTWRSLHWQAQQLYLCLSAGIYWWGRLLGTLLQTFLNAAYAVCLLRTTSKTFLLIILPAYRVHSMLLQLTRYAVWITCLLSYLLTYSLFSSILCAQSLVPVFGFMPVWFSYFCEIAVGSMLMFRDVAGYNCEVNEDNCNPNPCQHGKCIDEVNGYRCVCHLPYSGPDCSLRLDPCSPNHCVNDAVCVPDATYQTFSCRCRTGYTGSYE